MTRNGVSQLDVKEVVRDLSAAISHGTKEDAEHLLDRLARVTCNDSWNEHISRGRYSPNAHMVKAS